MLMLFPIHMPFDKADIHLHERNFVFPLPLDFIVGVRLALVAYSIPAVLNIVRLLK